jgi:hypothetical protein
LLARLVGARLGDRVPSGAGIEVQFRIEERTGNARDCVRLAEQADTQELREKLLNLAREWMRAVIEEEDTVMSSQAAE